MPALEMMLYYFTPAARRAAATRGCLALSYITIFDDSSRRAFASDSVK